MSSALDIYKMEYEDVAPRKLHLKKRGTRCSPEEKKRRKEILLRRKAERMKLRKKRR